MLRPRGPAQDPRRGLAGDCSPKSAANDPPAAECQVITTVAGPGERLIPCASRSGLIPDSCQGRCRPGSVEGGRRPSPQATRSALDGFRPTPDNREAGMSHPGQSASSIDLARPRAGPQARARHGQRRAAERSGAALIGLGSIRQWLGVSDARLGVERWLWMGWASWVRWCGDIGRMPGCRVRSLLGVLGHRSHRCGESSPVGGCLMSRWL